MARRVPHGTVCAAIINGSALSAPSIGAHFAGWHGMANSAPCAEWDWALRCEKHHCAPPQCHRLDDVGRERHVHDERQRCVTFECLHRTALVLVVLGAESCHSPHLSSSGCDCAAAPIAVAALRWLPRGLSCCMGDLDSDSCGGAAADQTDRQQRSSRQSAMESAETLAAAVLR